ncbi:MAG: hypothetical protein KDB03_22520 [Planctomycetales bacterium]|nr:hypothetical protein [Planctomycetales bacterium]
MTRRRDQDLTVGEDAFLDTTANLVGILIILVVVIGAGTKTAADQYSRQLADSVDTGILDEPAREANARQQSLQEQQLRIHQYVMEATYRKAERDALLQEVALTRESVQQAMQEVTDETRQKVIGQQMLGDLRRQISEAQEKLAADEAHPRPQVILEHLPTPMAKTVFSREMHVRLQAGQVTVIPWDRLVESLKQHVPLAASRHQSRPAMEETLGPIGGFLMRYRMQAIPGGFELERFEIESVQAPTETVAETLSSTGRLRLELAGRDPAETVITVWVYPDSFAEFRVLKSQLFEEGFLTAARPLPNGIRIGASPNGTRSTAQ